MESNSPSESCNEDQKQSRFALIRKQLYRPIGFITHSDVYEVVTWFVAALTIGLLLFCMSFAVWWGVIITGVLLCIEAAFVVYLKRKQPPAKRPEIALRLKFGKLEVGQPIGMQFEAFNTGDATAYKFGVHISCDWKNVGFDGILDYGIPKFEEAEPIRAKESKYVHPQWDYILERDEFIGLTNG